MGIKHGWVKVSRYIQIHKNVLKSNGINSEYTIKYLTDQALSLKIDFTMTTKSGKRAEIKIEKICEIDINQGKKDPPAKTFSYSYHAKYKDGRNLLRYCSPDREMGHRAHHHRHFYDSLGEENPKSPQILEDDTHPHVSEFLEEIFNNF